MRPTFDEIVVELQTNPEFITKKVNKKEFERYIKFINESPKSFNSKIKKIQLSDSLKKKFTESPIQYLDKEMKRKSKDTNTNFDLTQYKSILLKQKISDDNRINKYIIYKENSNENIELFQAEMPTKSISNLFQHEIKNISRQIKIISEINHPAINKFIGYSSVDFDNKQKPVIVTNYYPNDLCDLIQQQKASLDLDEVIYPEFDETKKLIIIYGIASAMSFLHSHNIIHRDLRPENISIFGCCKNSGFVVFYPKLSGFNISKVINGSKEVSQSIKGTPAYLAPEVYLKHEYSKASDVYSFSLLMYELITLRKPFDISLSPKQIKEELIGTNHHSKHKELINDLKGKIRAIIQKLNLKNHRPIFEETITEPYQELIERCWSNDPEKRPTFDEIINELKTNPKITAMIDKEIFFEYVNYLDKYQNSFDPSKSITQFDETISSIDNEFRAIQSYPWMTNIYQTEKNDLSFDDYSFDYTGYEIRPMVNGTFFFLELLENKEKNKKYVIKKFVKISDYYYISIKEILNFLREIAIRARLNHPAILEFIAYDQYHGNLICIIESYESVSLNKLINKCQQSKQSKENKEIDETIKLIIIYGIASAMSYLHSHNIIHRDLKPSNIFLNDLSYPKLSGFNISKIINGSKEVSQSIKGTPAYLAPEVYLKHEYSKASDVYSFSLLMYELITLRKPFDILLSPKQIKEKLIEKDYRPEIDETITEPYRELIKRCWSSDPQKRPTFDEIINELRTNPKIITEKINKEKYEQYIKMIDESSISFKNTNQLVLIKDYIESLNLYYYDKKSSINFQSIYTTELNNVECKYNFINIDDYEYSNFIDIEHNYILCTMYHKQTKKMYFVQKFNKKYDRLSISERENIRKTVNTIEFNHPSILKCIGYCQFDTYKFKSNLQGFLQLYNEVEYIMYDVYSINDKHKPAIFTEYCINGSLQKILYIDILNQSKTLIDDTKRLIILYGIASGMSYLHSKEIIHLNFSIFEILLDDYLFPKIKDSKHFYTLQKNYHRDQFPQIKKSVKYFNCIIDHPDDEQSKASNVFCFATMMYLLIYNKFPFPELTEISIERNSGETLRPIFDDSIPKCYRKLIEKCWSIIPDERPSFEEIVNQLRTNTEFIYDKINQDEYKNYIDFIEISSSKSVKIEDFIKTQKVQIDLKKIRESKGIVFSTEAGTIDINKFEKIEKVGSGASSNVYKVIEKETGNLYAAKKINCNVDNDIFREINIISQLNHPSIIKFIGFSPKSFKNNPKPVIITEYVSNGSLKDILKLEQNGCACHEWNSTKKLICIYGIASGMAYLHQRNIIHRDLKPANILLDDYLHPKIADFGLSKFFDNDEELKYKLFKSNRFDFSNTKHQFKGTLGYAHPLAIEQGIYRKFCDIYAFGLIVYEILNNESVFNSLVDVYKNCIQEFWMPNSKPDIPKCYTKLIKDCWYRNISFEKIIKELETKSDYITPDIDKEEYYNYISFIKDEHCNHMNFNKISFFDKFLSENDSTFNMPKDVFLDLTKYTKKSLINRDETSKLYKLKEIETNDIFLGQFSIKRIERIKIEEINKLAEELKKIKKLNHPILLKFIGFSPIDFNKKRKPVIVTEYLKSETLENILKIERIDKPIKGWDDTKKLIVIYGIAKGMSYLHSNEIIHRSLKPSSIYLDENLTPKIGDFGLSTRFLQQDFTTTETTSGIKNFLFYLSPETLLTNKYSKSNDVYSFSLIVYEMLCKKIPFEDIYEVKNIIEGKHPIIDEKIPLSYRCLIEKCWPLNPDERLTFDDIVHMLETDKGFITEKVNEKLYQRYIEFIKNQIESSKGEFKIDEIFIAEMH